MTKSEMKKIMKPLVKECLQEMLLQEGLLSSLISEVMKGQQKSVVTEQREQPRQQPQKPQARPQVSDVRKKLADSIGNGAYANIFEGMEPTPSPDGTGVDNGDPGMDLSILNNIPGLSGFNTRKNGK